MLFLPSFAQAPGLGWLNKLMLQWNVTLQALILAINEIFFSDTELKITQPSFTSSVGGYSSYLAYPVTPSEVSNDLEAQFHFSSLITDQVLSCFIQLYSKFDYKFSPLKVNIQVKPMS